MKLATAGRAIAGLALAGLALAGLIGAVTVQQVQLDDLTARDNVQVSRLASRGQQVAGAVRALQAAEGQLSGRVARVQQVAGDLNGGYTSECNQLETPVLGSSGSQITYYFPCSPVPQNPVDQ
jgi:hypothetical protein